jgi:hypothetical protein
MNARSDISACANPGCNSKFVRLGEGELHVFPIQDPKAWGMSQNAKQKVFWMCENCCSTYYIRLDRRHKQAQVVHRPETSRRVA